MAHFCRLTGEQFGLSAGNRSMLLKAELPVPGVARIPCGLQALAKSTKLDEMLPVLLHKEVETTLLDVPDAILDLKKRAGQTQGLGPISEHPDLAAAFPKDAAEPRKAFDEYLVRIKADGTCDRLVDEYCPGIRRCFPEFFVGERCVRRAPERVQTSPPIMSRRWVLR